MFILILGKQFYMDFQNLKISYLNKFKNTKYNIFIQRPRWLSFIFWKIIETLFIPFSTNNIIILLTINFFVYWLYNQLNGIITVEQSSWYNITSIWKLLYDWNNVEIFLTLYLARNVFFFHELIVISIWYDIRLNLLSIACSTVKELGQITR